MSFDSIGHSCRSGGLCGRSALPPSPRASKTRVGQQTLGATSWMSISKFARSSLKALVGVVATCRKSAHFGACTLPVENEEFARPGELVVVVAGIPFGQSGSTNNLRVIRIGGWRVCRCLAPSVAPFGVLRLRNTQRRDDAGVVRRPEPARRPVGGHIADEDDVERAEVAAIEHQVDAVAELGDGIEQRGVLAAREAGVEAALVRPQVDEAGANEKLVPGASEVSEPDRSLHVERHHVARISRRRPTLPILAITPDLGVARRMALMDGTHTARHQAGRSPGAGADQVRAGHQSQGRQGNRARGALQRAARRQGDRLTRRAHSAASLILLSPQYWPPP